ncbi:hydroxyacylglutathione hydrolase [Leisingera daeponensis]|uniref:Hydroxyacylglutathione hydrolase n=1 Tax=Leisingera daeponensis TaxID=405746 RepID=A0ABS7ND49_9RHOB|nr:hydroxyacylglutathione hydrolase [Leisingera daeponensis]MBY6139123.1 hydroxyacylglutathione hydrolase [Leisingera daeponensis]
MTMPLEIVTLPCLSDNYAFLIHNPASGETALVDAPEAGAIRAALSERGWGLDRILLTHHHWDHVDGVAELREAYGAKVIGAAADASRLPPLDMAVEDGGTYPLLGEEVQVMDVSGHTVGHIAFYIPGAEAVFTADSLMALGCGRLFEGTPQQMWASLSQLAALPPQTMVYSGHEYTQANGAFAVTVDPGNPALQSRISDIAEARGNGLPTVPSSLQLELDTNPFLRAADRAIRAHLGMQDAEDAEVFAEIRKRKDNF